MHPALISRIPSGAGLLVALLFLTASGSGLAQAAETGAAIAPKLLIDLASPDAGKQAQPDKGVPAGSTIVVDKNGVNVNFAPFRHGDADHPGVRLFPASGTSWDISAYGHVEAKITNTGDRGFSFIMLVVDEDGSFWRIGKKNEAMEFKPGETRVFKVPFGKENIRSAKYANVRGRMGPQVGALPNPAKVAQVFMFLYSSTQPHSFRIEELKAAGSAGEGENPYSEVDPDSVLTTPENGVIVGKGAGFDPAKQVEGGKCAAGPDGALALSFAGGKEETVKIKTVMGAWDLGNANQIRVTFKNTGSTPVTPAVVVGPNKVAASHPLAPGADAEVIVPFLPNATPVVAADPRQKIAGPGKWEDQNWTPRKDTGTNFESHRVKNFSILSDNTPGAKSLLVTSIVADAAVDEVPAWVGKKPPVDGDWAQTFDEEFDGPALDFKRWNLYGHNDWDKRTHFSKNNVILKDGKLFLHYEKKTGFHNDDAKDTEIKQTDYASGYLSTYGKWTQKYGYFEARMKLPRAPGLWPTFLLLPDRGKAAGTPAVRTSICKESGDTGVGGMEVDIMDFLSGWGVYRYNIACHWDGYGSYGKNHKSAGSPTIYARADKDGYITSGLLWTPGAVVMYHNGKEAFRWEGERVGDVQSHLRFDLVAGGWTMKDVPVNSQLDDAKLPDDFIIDYVRVWQRKDLATPGDGPKPNPGDPDEAKN